MTLDRIGFVGVGRMGGRMARRLVDAGYPLTIFDTSEDAMRPLLDAGAERAGSPSEVGSAAEIVLASLPTPPVVYSAVMVSCPEATFATVQPVLEHLGKLFFMGTKPGQGQTMKLLNNLLSATAMAISSEAVVMGVKAGLDAKQVVDVINSGTGRNTATEDKFPKFILPRKFNLGFAIGLLNKDVRLCMEEAEALGTPMIVGSAVKQ